jgi:diguanylate cyclase (GGDEF)-like protein/putative nucleotidyltransferase with HDIG domain
VRDVFALLALAALISTVIGATFGAAALILGGLAPRSAAWEVWHVWWLGDVAADVIVAPLLLALLAAWPWRSHKRHAVPTRALLLATVAGAVICAAGIVVAAHATSGATTISPADRVLLIQSFVMAAAITTLALAAIIAERECALDGLRVSEAAATKLAEEQSAISRVAHAIARETAIEGVYGIITEAAATLLGTAEALVLRSQEDGSVIVVGAWSRRAGGSSETEPAPPGSPDDEPLTVRGRPWGYLRLHTDPVSTTVSDPARVRRALARLLALGIANAEDRSSLLARASTDPLTGLANHRAFHERLAAELERANRYGRAVSVAMFDIDRFKAINDTAGHKVGDEVLAEVATRVAAVMRGDSIVARLGGDELAVLLPECDAMTAYLVAERARHAVSSDPIDPVGRVTVSAGVCSSEHSLTPERLLELADGALYWAKAHGRDACFRYSEDVVMELSAAERADRLARSQALTGLRALARAIDAKDPATHKHAERVAELAGALAQARGWTPERIEMLRETALVHDVGKLAVPDSILAQLGPLSPEQHEQIKRHAAIGAQIASEVLGPEQVEWIRWHHERADGLGYPDGLTAEQLPEGARLLALADAWEAMTSVRAHRAPKGLQEAIDACVALSGKQFCPDAIAALLDAHRANALALALLV